MKNKPIDGAIWFDMGDHGVRCHLWMQILAGIQKTGSISGTAQKLESSYSKVYNEIVQLNCVAGKKLIISVRGGIGGGFAELTPDGAQVLELYIEAEKRFGRFIRELNRSFEPFF
ncbi:winged helix-turn-helix domain-containing protein [Gaoshiqia sediminis]|uniref:LysR family transcriptional regulator n=1 Tax=Gaoshiqia sediminis TaxID=2986998 RepID=A0AA42C4F3_9BACT|nr:LysR family transcriptional regulator [Gaoshiqia sediminis]MCW0481713.1 LysR family transcriptional regulator [Gaoshiqia sediminis]